MRRIILLFSAACLFPIVLLSQSELDFGMPETAEKLRYKQVDSIDLFAWVFKPELVETKEKRPAIIFFFGGGWSQGTPKQFAKHCEYLAARGIVAVTAEYRVKKRHGVSAEECIKDAKSAIRWLRQNASQLGIDPTKIIAAGGSAGGHLAAATATVSGFDHTTDLLSVDAKPNALILFNPVLVLAPVPEQLDLKNAFSKTLKKRFNAPLESVSPYHNLNKGIVPTLIFHGTEDKTVPFSTIELYAQKMKRLGNRCELLAYEGMDHAFFNYGRFKNGPYVDTVNKMDAFLVSLEYLNPLPQVHISK